MLKNLQVIVTNFLQIILYKIFFTINFVRSIYEFYNIVKNNYS